MAPHDIERLVAGYAAQYPHLLTFAEAAEIARHKTKATIYDWSSKGYLDAIKTRRGRHALLDRDGFIRFLLDPKGQDDELVA